MDFVALAQQCASSVEPRIMQAIMRVESSGNPYAIGVVNGRLERQPRNMEEAVATAHALERDGWNFSLGATQVNRHNLPKYKLDYREAFDPCANIDAGSRILRDCYDRAKPRARNDSHAWKMAFSCYYSGNFKTGFKPDFKGQPSYVAKVSAHLEGSGKTLPAGAIPVVASRTPAPVAEPPRLASRPAQRPARQLNGSANDAWAVFGAKEI